MTRLVLCALALSACAVIEPTTPEQIAREDCRTWLGRVGFAEGLRRGTARWDEALAVCTAERAPWVGVDR